MIDVMLIVELTSFQHSSITAQVLAAISNSFLYMQICEELNHPTLPKVQSLCYRGKNWSSFSSPQPTGRMYQVRIMLVFSHYNCIFIVHREWNITAFYGIMILE